MKRVLILVNKDFEYKGFIEGLRDTIPVYAGSNGRDAECNLGNVVVDIYCIQHLFKDGENSSNSEVKLGLLKDLFRRNELRFNDVDYTISVSTSESTLSSQGSDGMTSRNGCVYVGNRFFLSDRAENDETTKSHLVLGSKDSRNTEWYDDKPFFTGLYDKLNSTYMRLERAHINPADTVLCFANDDYTSVGVVNVMDYSRYAKADKTAFDMFCEMAHGSFGTPVGIETTHGVVKKAIEDVIAEMPIKKRIPVMFVSPIVDRYLRFDEDVDKSGRQNYICSYNSGVVTGHALKIINETFKEKENA